MIEYTETDWNTLQTPSAYRRQNNIEKICIIWLALIWNAYIGFWLQIRLLILVVHSNIKPKLVELP